VESIECSEGLSFNHFYVPSPFNIGEDCTNSRREYSARSARKFDGLVPLALVTEPMEVLLPTIPLLLHWMVERWDGVMWTGLVWIRIGTGGELL
jgi:hypothetical protein